ncbi:MAG TPA: diacylglycerol kinase family protein, partial [Actinotalea sp.]|nr:diacylglycerol kinase family protein [Actinotalea sp.]
MTWHAWLSLLAVLVALVAVYLAVQNRRSLALLLPEPRSRARAATTPPTTERPLVAFIANPTKPGFADLRDRAVQACAARYLPEPLFFETTAEDPDVGQTREALAGGAQLVVAAGGDGTVRAVAEALANGQVAMAVLPQGTGNLLARNLDLPLSDLDAQLRIALTGNDRVIDVGWLTVLRDEKEVSDPIAEADPHAAEPERTPPGAEETARRHIFLVMA